MANSPLISIRIPPETLARIDQLAQKRYPSRRTGKKPNRSQVILDAIEQFLDQYELQESTLTNTDFNSVNSGELLTPIQIATDEQLVTRSESNYQVIHAMETNEPSELNLPDALNSYETDWPQPTNQFPKIPADMKVSSTRKYIDWWLDYFSYVGKLTKPWFISKR